MAEEEKTMNLVDKIEKLITGGNKEIIDRIDRLENGQKKLEGGQRELIDRVGRLEDKLESVHSSLKTEISVTAVAVKETVKEEIKRVEDKLDLHMRQPAHAGM